MKKTVARRSNHSLANSNSNEKDSTMKKTVARRSNHSLANSNSTTDGNAAILAQVAALLGVTLADADGDSIAATPQAAEKAPKADRLYEMANIGADFRKNRIYATPTSEVAARYMAECKALCADTIGNLKAPIAADVRRIAEKAENNAGESLKDDLIILCDNWKIPPQAMRVIMQLCAPVVACCNAESDDIARRCYGMPRANALMGSACNMLMWQKAADKDAAIPFKRVAHNLTALGLAFDAVASIEECDFCTENEAFGEVITLCDYWLNKCEKLEKAAEKAAPQVTRRGRNAEKAAPQAPAQADNAAILAKIAALLGM